MDKNKEFIKEIKIDKKRRFRYNFITLLIFNALFLSSLIYMFALLNNTITAIVSILLFAFTVFGSVRTLVNSKHNKKYLIYRDKIAIESPTFKGEIDLSNVFMVKPRKNIFDIIFRKGAHLLVVYVKNEREDVYFLSFLGEDVDVLADDIMKLAIQAREKNHRLISELVNKKQGKKLITKKMKQEKSSKISKKN